MNEVVFFSLLLLIFIRLIGLGLSVDIYLRNHAPKFKVFILGWTFWFLAGIFPILSDITNDIVLVDTFLVINGILASLGTLMIYLGIIYNFKYIQLKVIVLLCVFQTITSITLAIFISSQIAIGFSLVIIELSIISIVFLHVFKGKTFITYVGKSIIWYYGVVIIGILFSVVSIIQFSKGYQYGLYYSNDYTAIYLNYSLGVGITILTVILFIHFEYSILNQQKFELKDIYSHTLGNIMQSILSATELLELDKEEDLLNMIKEKCSNASELIKKIRKLQ